MRGTSITLKIHVYFSGQSSNMRSGGQGQDQGLAYLP
jgi:hypothetical protein